MDGIVVGNVIDKIYSDTKHHDNVLQVIHSYFTDDKYSDIVLEAGIDKKRNGKNINSRNP